MNSGNAILNSNNLPDRRYVYGPGIDEPIVRVENPGGAPVHYYNHQDALGSVVAVSDETGVVANKYTYGVHGESGSLSGNPYRFTGRRLDPETGLYYYRARYYSASLGRFMQNDPIGYAGGDNLYAYVLNDPVNLTDPSGLATVQLGVTAGLSIQVPFFPGLSLSGQINGGVAFDTHGNVGLYGSPLLLGPGVGQSIKVGGSVAVANADNIRELQNMQVSNSIAAGDGFGGSIDAGGGIDSNGNDIRSAGITLGIVAGLGYSQSFGPTYVVPLTRMVPALGSANELTAPAGSEGPKPFATSPSSTVNKGCACS